MAGEEDPSSKSTATSRLEQVQQHLTDTKSPATTANSSKRRRARKQKDKDELPADYSDILGQVATLKKMAITPDPTNRGYQRQKKAGKMWVRERVEAFVDPGTFKEVGSVSGTVEWRSLGGEREEPVKCM
jgi:hypothetical protein